MGNGSLTDTRARFSSIKRLTACLLSRLLRLHYFSTQSKLQLRWIIFLSLCLSCCLLPPGLCTCCSPCMESSPLFTWLTTAHSSTLAQASLTSPSVSSPCPTLTVLCISSTQSTEHSLNAPPVCAITVKSLPSRQTLQEGKDHFCLNI